MNRKVFKAVGILGLAIAAFAAPRFTTKANVKQSDTYWLIFSNSSWTQFTGQGYTCTGAPGPCLMRFTDGKTPADGLEHGIPEGGEEGYAVLTP